MSCLPEHNQVLNSLPLVAGTLRGTAASRPLKTLPAHDNNEYGQLANVSFYEDGG